MEKPRGLIGVAVVLLCIGCTDRSTTEPAAIPPPSRSPIDPCHESWPSAECADLDAAIWGLIGHADAMCQTLGWTAYDRMVGGGGTAQEFMLMEYEQEMQDYYALSTLSGASSGRTLYNSAYWHDWDFQSQTNLREMLKSLVAHEEAHHWGLTNAGVCAVHNTCSSNPIPNCSH